MIPQLIVFDMAGTTIHASNGVPAAFRSAFESEGISLTSAEINDVRGRAKPDAISQLLQSYSSYEPGRSSRVFNNFRRALLDHYRENGVSEIDGACETFAWCMSAGIKLALTTGFDRELAELLVELAGFDGRFDVLIADDDVEHGRPAPDLIFEAMSRTACANPASVAAVGDTVSDLKAARAAGVGWSVAVLSGAHGADRLQKYPHSVMLASVADIPDYFLNS